MNLCMQTWKKMQKGKMDLPALEEENLAKDSEENNKNWMILLCRVREREKMWKNFWKSVLNWSNIEFKKKKKKKN